MFNLLDGSWMKIKIDAAMDAELFGLVLPFDQYTRMASS